MSLAAFLCLAALVAPPAFSHATFDSVLAENVHSGSVGYKRLHSNRAQLDRYVRQLAEARPEQLSTRADSVAFFINAYNALALKGVLDRYPIRSVIKVRAGLLSFIPTTSFFKSPATVGGESRTLDDIEHGILRKRWREPRIHFAIVCASRSCPPLRSSAFSPDSLEAQLASQAELFVNDPFRNRWDDPARVFHDSKIFHWVKEDFGGEAGTKALIRRYFRGRLPDEFALDTLPYDWDLNGE